MARKCKFRPSMHKYYQILGLKPGASKEEIKKAYRKKAMQYHPDRNPGPDAREKFTEVLEAYEYLTGVRQARQQRQSTTSESDFYEQMRKQAEERAKAHYRQRVREFRKWKEEQQNLEYQKAIVILMGLLLVGLAVWQGGKFYTQLMINRQPVIVQAEVVGLSSNRMIYRFPVGDSVVEERTYVRNYKLTMIAGNGLPLKAGDRFSLTYNAGSPGFHEINFDKVAPQTMRRYLGMTARRLQIIYADEWDQLTEGEKNVRSTCLVLLIFKEFGFDGLSKVVFYDVSVLENLSHNTWTWHRLKNSEAYQALRASCEADPSFEHR